MAWGSPKLLLKLRHGWIITPLILCCDLITYPYPRFNTYLARLLTHLPRVLHICIGSALVQIRDCRIFGVKPLSETMLEYWILLIGPLTNFSEITIKIHLILIQGNAFENGAILSHPQCVNKMWWLVNNFVVFSWSLREYIYIHTHTYIYIQLNLWSPI